MTQEKTWVHIALLWIGGIFLSFAVICGCLYLYGWYINPELGYEYSEKYMQWRIKRLRNELFKLNGHNVDLYVWRLKGGLTVDSFDVRGKVKDLSPLMSFDSRSLRIDASELDDLSVLKTVSFEILSIQGMRPEVTSLEPLRGKATEVLTIEKCSVQDISPLKGMNLRWLDMADNNVEDISALAGMPLCGVNLNNSKVKDLTPLAGAPLVRLYLNNTRITNLEPLTGMKLRELYIANTKVEDLTPLKGMKFEKLDLCGTNVSDLSPVLVVNRRYEISYENTPEEEFFKPLP